jgi:hypothetical protein
VQLPLEPWPWAMALHEPLTENELLCYCDETFALVRSQDWGDLFVMHEVACTIRAKLQRIDKSVYFIQSWTELIMRAML